MTIPIQPFPDVHPQVIIPPHSPDALAVLLNAIMQGAQQGSSAYEHSQSVAASDRQHAATLDIERQRLALTRDDIARRAQADADALAARRAEGQSILAWMAAGAPRDQLPSALMPPTSAGAAAVPGAPPGVGNMEPDSAPMLRPSAPSTTTGGPGATGATSAAPSGALPISQNPLAALAPFLRDVPPEAIPETVQRLLPALEMQQNWQLQADKIGRINTALANIKDPGKRAGAVGLLGLAEGGVHPSQEEIGRLYPQLAVVDPSAMNSALDFWRTTAQPWGRVRSAFRLPSSAIPDEIVYTPPGGKDAGKLSEQDKEAAMQLPILQQSNATMKQMEAKGVELGLLGAHLKKNPGGALGDFLNSGQSADQRAYLSAQFAFSDVASYAFSGKTATASERLRIMQDFAAQGSDPLPVREQKAKARDALILAMQDRLSGALSTTQAADRLLRTPYLTPEQRATVRMFRAQGAAYEQQRRSGRGLPVTVTDTPTPPEGVAADSSRMMELIDQLPDSALGTRPGPQRGAPRNTLDNLLDFSRAFQGAKRP